MSENLYYKYYLNHATSNTEKQFGKGNFSLFIINKERKRDEQKLFWNAIFLLSFKKVLTKKEWLSIFSNHFAILIDCDKFPFSCTFKFQVFQILGKELLQQQKLINNLKLLSDFYPMVWAPPFSLSEQ